jgi:hypothetical protein
VQILEILLYNSAGDRRSIAFAPGRLNVVTGESKTGKSSLVEIVRYCLGEREFLVPHGVIADTVRWYGLRVLVGSTEVFIARPPPDPGRRTSNAVALHVGKLAEAPTLEELEPTTNTDSLTEYLTRLLGIGENLTVPPDESTRPAFEATVDHALLFNFQRQDEIADRTALFHRQAEPFMAQALRDTLPYFLGAVDFDALSRRRELQLLRDALRRAQQRLDTLRARRERTNVEAFALLNEAQEVGLLPEGGLDQLPPVDSEARPDALIALLAEAARSRSGLPELSSSSGVAFSDLERERATLADRYREVRDEILLVQAYVREHGDYVSEANEQSARLSSVDILPGDDRDAVDCPLCQQPLERGGPMVESVRASLQSITQQINAVEADIPRLQRTLGRLEDSARELRGRLGENQRALESIAAQRAEVEELRERINAQSFVRGRINHYIEVMSQAGDVQLRHAEQEVVELQAGVEAANQRLSDQRVVENVVSILNVVGRDMAIWAQQLELEYSDSPVRIDIGRLNVVADTEGGPVPLQRMGSAANWVGYHLVAHLALHKLFAEKRRPVPRFLMLDQPTQAFFPPDAPTNEEGLSLDADRAAVARMFRLLYQVSSQLSPEFQIIVMDHARLTEPWFRDSIVEDWRESRKLVPPAWL